MIWEKERNCGKNRRVSYVMGHMSWDKGRGGLGLWGSASLDPRGWQAQSAQLERAQRALEQDALAVLRIRKLLLRSHAQLNEKHDHIDRDHRGEGEEAD